MELNFWIKKIKKIKKNMQLNSLIIEQKNDWEEEWEYISSE